MKMINIEKFKTTGIFLFIIIISCNNNKPNLKVNKKKQFLEMIVIQENGASLYSSSSKKSNTLLHLPLYQKVKLLHNFNNTKSKKNLRVFVQINFSKSNKTISGWVHKKNIKLINKWMPDTEYLKPIKSLKSQNHISKVILYIDKRGLDSFPNSDLINMCNNFYKAEICHFALFKNNKFINFHQGCLPTKWSSNTGFECQQNLNDGGCLNKRVWNISSKNFKRTIIWEQSICYEGDPRTSSPTITMCKKYNCLHIDIDKYKKTISITEDIDNRITKIGNIRYNLSITSANKNNEYCILVDRKELCYSFKIHGFKK